MTIGLRLLDTFTQPINTVSRLSGLLCTSYCLITTQITSNPMLAYPILSH